MDAPPPPPPPPFLLPSSSSASASPSPPPSTSSNASTTMVIITVVGILAAFTLLASYYAFVTKCQPLRALWYSRNPPWRQRARGRGASGGQMLPEPGSVVRAAVASREHSGLGLPLIRMLPVVKFTAEAAEHEAAARISVSECAVCLSEFEERERVRLLPNCSHAFHIDCIDTWLQGSARCPFCRSDVTLPAALPLRAARSDVALPLAVPRCCASTASKTTSTTTTTHHSSRRDAAVANNELTARSDSIVIEVRGEREAWFGGGSTPPAGRRYHNRRQKRKAESVGDEAIDTRKKDKAFAVQPLRRSLSLDSSCDKHLYESVRELLITKRQGYDPSVV